MKIRRSTLSFGSGVLMAGCVLLGVASRLHGGSDSSVAVGVTQDARSFSIRADEYLKRERVEHAVETSSGGDTTTVKIYDVTSAPRQDVLCAGLTGDIRREHPQGITVQFLVAETSTAAVQNYQPSGLPSGNASVTNTQRTIEKSNFKLLRVVKLQETASK